MTEHLLSEAILFWGFVANETKTPYQAFGWKENVWQYELARRCGIEQPEKIVSQRRKDEWAQWRQHVDSAVDEWSCTFSWYGTECDKRYFVAVTNSMYVADGAAAISCDMHLAVPDAWQIKLDAFCHLMHIPRDATAKLGWKLVARDRAFVDLPDVED